MTARLPRRLLAWAAGTLVVALPLPALAADSAAGGRRLPPVVEMGTGGAPAAAPASREILADLLQQLETLQAELRSLRGQVEVQNNEIERLKARQRELLADIDRRVSELEHRGPAGPAEAATTGAATSPYVIGAQEQKDYDAAFNLMRQGQYDRAAKGLRDFLAAYPQSPLRDNARYWLGEAYYVKRDFRKALAEFNHVLNDHPASLKSADALLKIGYSHYELGEWAKAREYLNQVVARYPGQPAAKSAEQRLAKMRKEGR